MNLKGSFPKPIGKAVSLPTGIRIGSASIQFQSIYIRIPVPWGPKNGIAGKQDEMMTENRKSGKKIKINDHNEMTDEEAIRSESEKEESGAGEMEENPDLVSDLVKEPIIDPIIDPITELEAEIEKAKHEAKDNYDRFLRVSAEFENYKKRSAREMDDFRKYANESLIRELLTVVDNLERAIESCNCDESAANGIAEGVHMTHTAVLKILEKFHVRPIDALGAPFDPAFHQAVMQEASEDNSGPVVLKEFQKGYMIHDRLLRPAMVVVSKPKETGDEGGEGQKDHLQEQDDTGTNQD